MTTTENNKIIAEFMGAKILSPNTKFSYIEYPLNVSTTTKGQHKETYKQCLHSKNLEYHSNWNWLMEVVKKMEGLHYEFILTTNIENTYNACIEFIKWYNEQK